MFLYNLLSDLTYEVIGSVCYFFILNSFTISSTTLSTPQESYTSIDTILENCDHRNMLIFTLAFVALSLIKNL